MTWEPRPVPKIYPETEPYWRAAAEGTLLLRECENCGLIYHYPRDLCPECLSEHVSWLQSDGEGHVYSYSLVHQLAGWPNEDLPLLLALVELTEGPRVFTNIVDCSPNEIEVGISVEVAFEETEKPNVAIPVFTLRS